MTQHDDASRYGQIRRSSGEIVNDRRHRRRCLYQQLEDRRMLAGEPLEQLVNTLVPRLQTSEQQSTAIEIAPNGDTLVVFNGRGPSDNDGIFVRRIPEDSAVSTDRRVNTTILAHSSDRTWRSMLVAIM